MAARYFCRDEERRETLRARVENEGLGLNGIDFLEVVDHVEVPGLPAPAVLALRQRFLAVHLFRPVPAELGASSVKIEGGARVPVRVVWARPWPAVQTEAGGLISAVEKAFLAAFLGAADRPANILIVRTDSTGDFSTYRLRLVEPKKALAPPVGFDPRLSEVAFSFKVECPADFDCKTAVPCPPPVFDEPEINYLAKDYASFRRLMLDRLSAIAPAWRERNPADFGIALVELLAYVGDHLSYYQDAVATEAYLGTARRRVSVRRHARLVDYFLDEGANARAYVAFEVKSDIDGLILPGPGTQIITRTAREEAVLAPEDLTEALAAGALVFETMHPLTLWSDHNAIRLYAWGDRECCLPAGATAATLVGPLPQLKEGDLLLFEEVLGPRTGDLADADPRRRHVVRLTRVVDEDDQGHPLVDPLTLPLKEIVEVEWDRADALPFPLCLSSVVERGGASTLVEDVSMARGNVVLADHGQTRSGEDLGRVPEGEPFRPVLDRGPLTHAAPLASDFDRRPASGLLRAAAGEGRPAVRLIDEDDRIWRPQRDLLASDAFADEIVVEMEEDGRAHLRFGDDVQGRAPSEGKAFTARYRTGNGPSGNVGAEALRHVVPDPAWPGAADLRTGLRGVRNPLPAQGGRAAESLEEVRQYAPQAFQTQQRAVTESDYAEVAERHPEVQRAAATFRWTGSWYTVFLTVDRRGGLPVDGGFERELREHLGFYRMAGHDLEVEPPRFVALDVAVRVCVKAGYLRDHVQTEILARLSSSGLAGGGRGLFHPDNWTFGQPVYLSRIYAAAAGAEGVGSFEVVRFQRWGRPAQGEIAAGVLPLGRLEIARLDNDPNFRENGRLELLMGGGR